MKTKSSFGLRPLALVPLAVLGLSGGLATAAAQTSIGVNFGVNAGTLAPTDSAGAAPFAQTNYNNVTAAPSGLILNDNSGAASPVALTTTGATSFASIVSAASGPDEILNDDRALGDSSSWSFSLTGITYPSYSIVVYDLQLGAGFEMGIAVGGLSYYTSSPSPGAAGYLDDDPATPYTYTQGTSTNSGAPTALGDYVVFTGLSGSAQTVTMTGFAAGGERIGGFQIVETVPEPATWALLFVGVGLLGVTLRRRSARRAESVLKPGRAAGVSDRWVPSNATATPQRVAGPGASPRRRLSANAAQTEPDAAAWVGRKRGDEVDHLPLNGQLHLRAGRGARPFLRACNKRPRPRDPAESPSSLPGSPGFPTSPATLPAARA